MKGSDKMEENWKEWHHGHGKHGFGFFIGLLLVAYGAYSIARFYNWIPNLAFPWFPAIILIVGLWMVLKRLMRN